MKFGHICVSASASADRQFLEDFAVGWALRRYGWSMGISKVYIWKQRKLRFYFFYIFFSIVRFAFWAHLTILIQQFLLLLLLSDWNSIEENCDSRHAKFKIDMLRERSISIEPAHALEIEIHMNSRSGVCTLYVCVSDSSCADVHFHVAPHSIWCDFYCKCYQLHVSHVIQITRFFLVYLFAVVYLLFHYCESADKIGSTHRCTRTPHVQRFLLLLLLLIFSNYVPIFHIAYFAWTISFVLTFLLGVSELTCLHAQLLIR